jgi:O-antigen/teichoic acid export membrane protein
MNKIKIPRAGKVFISHGYGQLVTVVANFILPPVLLGAYGAELYGYWVIAFSVSQFFLNVDIGVSLALPNYVILLKNEGELKSAAVIEATRLCLSRSIYLALFLATIGFIADSTFNPGVKLTAIYACLVLCLNSGLNPLLCLYVSIKRLDNKQPFSIVVSNTVRMVEVLVIFVAAKDAASILELAVCILASKLIIVLIINKNLIIELIKQHLKNKNKVFCNRIKIEGGIGFTMVAMSNALALHLPVLVIGYRVGPEYAAVYTLSRTLARFPAQIVNIALDSMAPDQTDRYAAGDFLRYRRVALQASLLALIGASIYSGVCFLSLDKIELIWLHKKEVLDGMVFIGVASAAAISLGSQAVISSLGAINQSMNVASVSVAVQIIGSLILWMALGYLSLGIAIWIFFALELILFLCVHVGFRSALKGVALC